MSMEHAEKLDQIKQLIESCMASEIDNDDEVDKVVIDSMACFYQSMTGNFPVKGIACKDVLQLLTENAELKKKVEEKEKRYSISDLIKRYASHGDTDLLACELIDHLREIEKRTNHENNKQPAD